MDGVCVWILHVAAHIANPKDTDFTWLVAGPLANATSGEMKDDMDYRIVASSHPRQGQWNMARKYSIAGHVVVLKRIKT